MLVNSYIYGDCAHVLVLEKELISLGFCFVKGIENLDLVLCHISSLLCL